MTPCPRCGTRLVDGRCEPCRNKDIKASCPAVLVDSEAFVVDHVRLNPVPGKLYPQPITLARAVELDLILTATEGNDIAYYLRSSRARLVLKPRKEFK